MNDGYTRKLCVMDFCEFNAMTNSSFGERRTGKTNQDPFNHFSTSIYHILHLRKAELNNPRL